MGTYIFGIEAYIVRFKLDPTIQIKDKENGIITRSMLHYVLLSSWIVKFHV